jgi:hypothetical protein
MPTTTHQHSDSDRSAFADIINRTNSDYGPSASRKAVLSACQAPLHVLNSLGVDVPHREFIDDPSDCKEFPTTAIVDDGTRVHLHQDVREQSTAAFGDFGAAHDDDTEVIWTVVDLTDETVTLTVVGDWSRRRNVPFSEFSEEYEPLYLEDGQQKVPRFGY